MTESLVPDGLASPHRRTLLKGVAWSVPVVTAAAVAPVRAASLGIPGVIVPSSDPWGVDRCSSVTSGAVTFAVTQDGQPAESGLPVTITLPDGLRFVDGSSVAVVSTLPGGVVEVPAFMALGAGGAYSITADIDGSVATISGTVRPGLGRVTDFTATSTVSNTTPTTTINTLAITQGAEGAVSIDNRGNRTGTVIQNGRAYYWGPDTDGTVTDTPALQYGGSELTGLSYADTFTGTGGSKAGGVVAGTSPSSVYQWWSQGQETSSTDINGTTPVVNQVTGITGTVLEVATFSDRSWVLTTDGVFTWATKRSGTGSITATGPLAGTAGASTMSAYAGGGAVLVNGQLKTWSGTGAATNVTGVETDSIQEIHMTGQGLVALSTSGTLYTRGGAWGSSPGGSSWTARATNVSSFSAWGRYTVRDYMGGIYVSNGVAYEFGGGSGSFGWRAYAVAGMAGKNVVASSAGDGTYMARTSDGQVYYWYGNVDITNTPTASQLTGLTGTVIDFEVASYHEGNKFYGAGYVITADACV